MFHVVTPLMSCLLCVWVRLVLVCVCVCVRVLLGVLAVPAALRCSALRRCLLCLLGRRLLCVCGVLGCVSLFCLVGTFEVIRSSEPIAALIIGPLRGYCR